MNEVKLLLPEEVAKMFSRLSELRLDTADIRRKFLNCPYGEDPKQVLDIYLPNEGDGPFPVVFFAHGGGWSGGSKHDTQVVPFMSGVLRGYAVISLGYRLTPHIRYPENLFDIKAALRWVAENADTYLLDATRTALCGASAGAQLAMMAAFTQGQPGFEGAPMAKSCTVRAVVNQFGPTDFSKLHRHYDESGFPRAQTPDLNVMSGPDVMLGVKVEAIPALLRFVSPIHHVHPGIPPVLIQHGRYDPIVAYQQGVELYDKIVKVCGADRAELDLSETFLHADPGYAGEESVDRIFTFLDAHVK